MHFCILIKNSNWDLRAYVLLEVTHVQKHSSETYGKEMDAFTQMPGR